MAIADQLMARRNRLFPQQGSAQANPQMPQAPAAPNATTMAAPGGGMAVPAAPAQPKAPQLDDSTSSNLTKIIDKGGDLMTRAAARGMLTAQTRGLMNSSMAAGASQAAVLDAATPIAQADANANLQKNLQATQIASTEGMQGKDIEAQAARLKEANAAEMARLQAQMANANEQQQIDIKAQMERLKISGEQELTRLQQASVLEQDRMKLQNSLDTALQSSGAEQQRALTNLQGDINSRLQSQTDAAAMSRLSAQFAQDVKMQDAESRAALERIAASGDQNVRAALIAADQARQDLAMQLAAGDRERVANTAVQIFAAEASIRQALLSNTTMPAAERAAYEQAIASLGNPVRTFIDQLYGTKTPTPTPGAGMAMTNPTGAMPMEPSGGGFYSTLDPAAINELSAIERRQKAYTL